MHIALRMLMGLDLGCKEYGMNITHSAYNHKFPPSDGTLVQRGLEYSQSRHLVDPALAVSSSCQTRCQRPALDGGDRTPHGPLDQGVGCSQLADSGIIKKQTLLL